MGILVLKLQMRLIKKLLKKLLVTVTSVLSNVNKMKIMILSIRNVVIKTAIQSHVLDPRYGSVTLSWMTLVILQLLKRIVKMEPLVNHFMEEQINVQHIYQIILNHLSKKLL